MSTTPTLDTERRTQAERTALSDARMLNAAVELICARGAGGTTLKEVGERAGYSRGLASYRFGNKGGLFAFIIRSIGEQWLHELNRTVQNKVGLEAISAATDAHHAFITDGSDHIRAFYILWFDSIGPEPELKRLVANIHERRRRDVAEWIRTGVHTGHLSETVDVTGTAEQFCAAIIGIVYQWLVTPDNELQIYRLHENLKIQTALMLQTHNTNTPANPRALTETSL